MKYFIKILWLVCICATGVLAQEGQQVIIRKFVEVPRDVVLQVIAVQPNCPIKFENVRFLASLEGGSTNSYELRNIGTKPIRSVTIASSRGDKNEYANNGDVLVMPGKLVREPAGICPKCVKEEIVPLTDELSEKKNLKTPMQSILLLMVVEVEFMDGTKYSDEKTYKSMTKYMEKLSDAVDEYEQRSTKRP